ncbi:transmembrane protein 213 [Anas platyrhynchos]|eukprot:XP_021129395.1 transmembrane protein 213 [Anas platyrhynchos]
MKLFSCKPWAALAVLFFTTMLQRSCSAAAEGASSVSTSAMPTTEYESPCLNVDFCTQAATCCQSGMDDYGWIAAAVGWSLWFLTLILLCVEKIMKLRPDEPKYLVA